MKNFKRFPFLIIFLLTLFIVACSNAKGEAPTKKEEPTKAEEQVKTEQSSANESQVEMQDKTDVESIAPDHSSAEVIPETLKEDSVDYSNYFNGVLGSAVFYTPNTNHMDVYETTIANEPHSPCSTFKIISSLIGMEVGAIDYENNTRKWSGEAFWNSAWNQDIGFIDAFQSSCVWYFREVIDQVGQETSAQKLKELEYGNCDISDWSGQLNQNNQNPALTGFWIESSLLITPIEQTKVLAKIFEPNTSYKQQTIDTLKKAMLIEENDTIQIYGKTGTGKLKNVLLDGWFVGFFTQNNENTYFAIYLGETDNPDISSLTAKEIAKTIIKEVYQN